MCERRMDKAQKAAKGGDKKLLRDAETLRSWLGEGEK